EEKINDAETLFYNRQSFIRFNQFKIDRTLNTLSAIDRLIFTTVPRLLHVNQEGLPGFVDENNVPCGIMNFTMDHESIIAAEKLFPERIIRRQENLTPVIHTALLMGSLGSIAQSKKSDLDYTLLVDKNSFTPENLILFQKKLNLIETWTWDNYHLETHFFINDHNEVRNNIFGESDSESTGSALAKLLKEEMYRTMIIVTGKVPFWLIAPVECDDERYSKLMRLIQENKTLLKREEYIDMGNVDDISNGEFFGASIWALIKSFKSPFKTLMKMGILEDYMFTETKSNLLCHQVKQKIFNGTPHDEIDPYLLMFSRVQKFFQDTKEEKQVDALRAAFYLKVGTQVSGEELVNGSSHWKKIILIRMLKEWGWDDKKVELINKYYIDWQMNQKVELGDRINKILMGSYKNISEKNSTLDASESLITEKDTNLLGRKLFSAYRSAPNKVENIGALVDGKTNEKELTFLYEKPKSKEDKGAWYLIRGRAPALIDQVDPNFIIKKTGLLPSLIAFTANNNLYSTKIEKYDDDNTEVLLQAESGSIKSNDLSHLLDQISSFISSVNIAAISNDELLADAQIKQLYIIADFGNPPPMLITSGDIKDCKNSKELNEFLNKRLERIQNISTIYITTWGELFCKTYSGLDCMNRSLIELSSQINPESVQAPNFLKYFIPSNRKELIKVPWLDGYILRSLKMRSIAASKKTIK
ncbi:MAG: class I adenylate cyclase, partial [Nitrospinaceae bacterium]